MTKDSTLPLVTDRLRIRDFEPDDVSAVHRYASNPEVTRYMSWGPNSEEDTRAFVTQAMNNATQVPRRDYELVLVSLAGGKFLGGCGLLSRREEYAEYEIGYWLAPEQWGKGYGSEAVRALLDFGFGPTCAHRVYASVDPENPTSSRLLEKLGFRLEGQQRKDTLKDGQWRDSLIYAIVDEEWKA